MSAARYIRCRFCDWKRPVHTRYGSGWRLLEEHVYDEHPEEHRRIFPDAHPAERTPAQRRHDAAEAANCGRIDVRRRQERAS